MRWTVVYGLLAACMPRSQAFLCAGGATLPANSPRAPSSRQACMTADPGSQTRGEVVRTMWKTALLTGGMGFLASPASAAQTLVTESGLKINKLVNGRGAPTELGDLVGVRFKGNYKDFEFDNILDSQEPYYMRVGGGNLVKGVEEAITMMHLGDKWEITCPSELGFGNKGRPPSPGRPRIPPGAELTYLVEVVSLPGKEQELFDLVGDEE